MGIIGIRSHEPVAAQLYDGLMMLQHRGQDAAGMVTLMDAKCTFTRQMGLASEVFNETVMGRMKGAMGMAHVLPTAGTCDSAEVQPFMSTPLLEFP